MAGNEWYYVVNGQRLGPVSGAELQREAALGAIQPQDLVWRNGLKDWIPAARVGGLFSRGGVALAPPPQNSIVAASGPATAQPFGYRSATAISAGYAGFWKRAAAALIDFIVLYAGGTIAGVIVGITLGIAGFSAGAIEPIAGLLGIGLAWLYYALMESSQLQGTLGKMALRIKVTDLQGERLSFGRATGRYFAKILSGLILCIGYLLAAFTEKKQALHDSLADCLVVNKG